MQRQPAHALTFIGLGLAALMSTGCSQSGSSRIGATTASTTSATTVGSVAAVTSLRVVGAPIVAGDVTVALRVTDATGAPATVQVEFSTDGVTWTSTTPAAGSANTTGLLTGPAPGTETIYVWNSAADVPGTTGVQLRARVAGGGLSVALAVDNQPLNPSVRLARQPYLQSTTQTSVIVAFRTDSSAPTSVEFGPTGSLGSSLQSPAGLAHAPRLSGLIAGEEYFYRVTSGGSPISRLHTLQTAPASHVADLSFVAFGDSGSGWPEQYALGARMASEDVDFALHTGDVVYPDGGLSDPVGEYDDKFFRPYEELLKTRPIFPVAGNHDRGVPLNLFGPYRQNFYLPRTNASMTSELYYSFEWGDAKFLMLESTIVARVPVGPTMRWLLDELQSNQRKWLIVVLHHPLYSSNRQDSYLRNLLEPLFELSGVDLVIAAHDHSYERSMPVRDFNPLPTYPGLTHLVTGGGGAGVDSHGPNSQAAVLVNVYHYLKIRIRGDLLHGQAIDIQGNVIDRFTIRNQ